MIKRKSEFERMAETKIADLESNIQKLELQVYNQRAEVKAWKEAIEHYNVINSRKKKIK